MIRIGDGLIPQIERFADKYAVNTVTIDTFQQIIDSLVEKADKPQDNTFVFIVNQKLFSIVNRVLGEYLANRHTDGAYLWSRQGQGKYIKVGATFDAYEWLGKYSIAQ